jgi:hypothetical protein
LDSKILDRALKAIEEVYNESMYGKDDLYRMKDIIHSVDENHWKSKEWLAEKIKKIYGPYDDGHTYIVGGWYGMMAYQIRKQWPNISMNITSADMDPEAKEIAWLIFHGYDLQFETVDIKDKTDLSEYSIIINTSCEHMEQKDLLNIIKNKDKNTWVCFQTNDYEELNSHTNCFKSAEEFADSLPIRKAYVGTLNLNDFNRFMVIGR